ncbi:MAG: DUF5937 family protein [Trebonia sp.]
MIELVFGSADLLQVRFAISPAEEILGAVRTVAQPARHAYHLPWLRQLPGTGLPGLAELTGLVTSRETPDFLSPPPTSPLADLEEQLDRLRSTPDEVIRAELAAALGDRVPGTLAQPETARLTLAGQMTDAWQRLLAPSWPQISALLQGDVLARGRRLAGHGIRAVFDGLHPHVRWASQTLRIRSSFTERLTLSGEGLLLVPSVFTWPDVQLMLDPPWQTTLIYPAPGVAAMWQPQRGDPALTRAFGKTRGTLLTELTEPATTTMLARKHATAASTISAHLTALRGAGLLTAHRDGRSTYYQLSALGYALLQGH